MSKRSTIIFNNPGLFVPSVVRGIVNSSAPTGLIDFDAVSDRNIGSTSSFRYDKPGAPLRSTQQVGVDFSKFENHTFFQSAQVNVQVATDKIINQYPFDGTRKEVEEFLDSLTGFERWLFDQIPKQKNFLYFSQSYVEVKDFAGSTFSSIAKNKTGDNILDPGLGTISFELLLHPSTVANDNQVVFQKLSGSNQGISLFLSESADITSASLVFNAVSGSSELEATTFIDKGEFSHVVATFDRAPGVNRLKLYVNETLVDESTNSILFGEINFNVSSFFIGSGSVQSGFTPQEIFSGAMDEFRVFHDERTVKQQELFAQKAIFAEDDLKLYLKFNEPPGLIGPTSASTTNQAVIDSSGNSIVGLIQNFDFSLRESGSVENPMTYEQILYSPVLFPSYQPNQDLNEELLISGSEYDKNNPNLITKLIPPHILLEGQCTEAFEDIEGDIIDPYTGNALPGSGELGQTQIIQTLLYIWAKFFDEIKIYLDVFGKSLTVDYNTDGTLPDQFLPQLAQHLGFSLPNLFTDASVEQFIDAENLSEDISTGDQSLQSIQNQIWRRILVNLKDIIRSKGTIHSVKSFIRTLGIDPDSNFSIREFGGPTKRSITDQREVKTEVSTMLNMSASACVIKSPYLSGSRIEIGFPEIQGSYVDKANNPVHGISDNVDDGLFTSGSWTTEAFYKFPLSLSLTSTTQSLMRMHITGTDATVFGDDQDGLLFNLLAVSGSNKIKLYGRPDNSTTLANTLELELTGADIFDGKQWNVSFGMYRHDDPSDYLPSGSIKSNVSASYFLRAGKADRGDIVEKYITSSFFLHHENNSTTTNALQNIAAALNASGSRFVVGSSSFVSSAARHLNDPAEDDEVRLTTFDGLVGHMRFWSRGLLEDEWKEHVRNFKSLGVENPRVHFNFATQETGSFGRIRIDTSTDQVVTSSDALGNIDIFDFSQNNLPLSGSGFEANISAVQPETFYFGYISPKFDEVATVNKVRARSLLEFDRAKDAGVHHGLLHEIPPNEVPADDVRFTIDFSIIDALDQDIINIFSTLKEMDNLIGNPELIYSADYPGLEELRDIYFNRLTDNINLKSFFEFFKWFDSSIGHFIESLIPRKTKFKGVNFVIESHMLERAKYDNKNGDIYLNASERHSLKGVILLQQIVGIIHRY